MAIPEEISFCFKVLEAFGKLPSNPN